MLRNKKVMFSAIGLFTALTALSVNASALSNRLFGLDRVKTAVSVAGEGWTSSDYAVVAYAWDFPDAVSAAPLAYKYNAPILLTEKESLNADTAAELDNLQVKHVFIVGGPGVVSANAEAQIKAKGIDVQRLWGNDRYQTSIAIANQVGQSNQIIITNGYSFGEALSISPIAAKKGIPIILTARDIVPDAVKNYISQNHVTQTYVLGKADGVTSDDGVADNPIYPNPVRISGSNVYERNINIINMFQGDLDFSKIYAATGKNFADALTGSVLAAKTSSPIVFVDDNMPQITQDFIASKADLINEIDVLGGTGAVSDNTVQTLLTNAQSIPGNTSTSASDNSTVTASPLSIASISNLTVSVNVGTSYTLPSKVTATTTDGLSVSLPVTWNPSTVNTNSAGTYTFTGTAHYYDAQTDSIKDFSNPVTLTLTVK